MVSATPRDASDNEGGSPPSGWRYRVGSFMFTIPFVMFFGAPIIIPLLGYSAGQAAALIGGIVVAAEVIWFASIPLLGIRGFKAMKKRAFSKLRLSQGPIGAQRHRWGGILLLVSIGVQVALQFGVLVAYFLVGAQPETAVLGLSFDQQASLYAVILVFAVVLLVVAVYMLGAPFAERLLSLFELPETTNRRLPQAP
jgi:hypothetical protein